MDNQKLLGLQRAEFEKSKTFTKAAGFFQLTVILISCITIAINKAEFSYFAAIFVLILSLGWVCLSVKAQSMHLVAERARRILLLSQGLGIQVTGKQYSDLFLSFSCSEYEGKKYQDENYFQTNKDPGYEKLADMLMESSFWTRHLYKSTAQRYWVFFFASLVLAIVLLFFLPQITDDNSLVTVSHILCVILTWLITGNIFRSALAFQNSATSINNIENRLESIIQSGNLEQDLIVVFCDYNSVTQSTATTPTSVYEKNKDKLNAMWVERQKYLNRK